jgi:nucleotide-binding universal stress UspA family protein
MRDTTIFITTMVLIGLSGCTTMTPEARIRNEVFWDAAKECESQYHSLHLDNVDPGGHLTMHADAETRIELAPFRKCYREAVRTRVEQRRRAGEPVPDTLLEEPTAEID